jgi:hypothetical protein
VEYSTGIERVGGTGEEGDTCDEDDSGFPWGLDRPG